MSGLSIRKLQVGQMAANCYIVSDPDTKNGIIIDPGDDPEFISEILANEHIIPVAVVATHGHFDHIMGAFVLTKTYGIPFRLHSEDAFLLDRMEQSAKHFLGLGFVDPAPTMSHALNDGDMVEIGSTHLVVLHTPGHTPGSVVFVSPDDGILFTGDTIFAEGAVGRTDHAYASRDQLRGSIQKILAFPEHTRMYPGHGSETDVGKERRFHIQ